MIFFQITFWDVASFINFYLAFEKKVSKKLHTATSDGISNKNQKFLQKTQNRKIEKKKKGKHFFSLISYFLLEFLTSIILSNITDDKIDLNSRNFINFCVEKNKLKLITAFYNNATSSYFYYHYSDRKICMMRLKKSNN